MSPRTQWWLWLLATLFVWSAAMQVYLIVGLFGGSLLGRAGFVVLVVVGFVAGWLAAAFAYRKGAGSSLLAGVILVTLPYLAWAIFAGLSEGQFPFGLMVAVPVVSPALGVVFAGKRAGRSGRIQDRTDDNATADSQNMAP